MREWRRVFTFFATSRPAGMVYANYLLRTHPSLFLLLDGHAISFNSSAKFAGKKSTNVRHAAPRHVASRCTLRRGRRGPPRTYIRCYICTPPRNCISSKFSVRLLSRRKNNEAIFGVARTPDTAAKLMHLGSPDILSRNKQCSNQPAVRMSAFY